MFSEYPGERIKVQRVFVEIFVFLLILLSFFKFLPEYLENIPEKIQIIPLMISMASKGAMQSLFILIGFLLITFVFGRIYCSYLCPLGVFQDALVRIWGKVREKVRFKYNPPMKILKFTILTLAILSLLSGSIYFVGWLDPFSLFGKVVTFIFKPFFVFMNNSMDLLLRKFNIYFLSGMEYPKIHLTNLIPFILILALILFFSIRRGRLYCNSVCPLGTFLGLISTRSVCRINIDSNNCTSCGLCESVCKAECIDSKDKRIDESSCIRCFNCISVCPESAINYIPFYQAGKSEFEIEKEKGISRRRFITYSASLIAFSGLNFIFRKNPLIEVRCTDPLQIWTLDKFSIKE